MTRKRRKPGSGTPPTADPPDDGYEVGFRKPPIHTRFKPGQSGNRKGRPRGSKNFATLFDKELSARVAVTEGGKRRTLSKREAIIKRLVQKGLEGDLRALQTLLKYLESVAATVTANPDPNQLRTLDPGDDAILADYEKSILERAIKPGSPKKPSLKTNEGNGE